MNEPIHIISLGAGVQSSTMALMAMLGLILPRPLAAIIADTQHEPEAVYLWLRFLCGVEVRYRPDGTAFVKPGVYAGGVLGPVIPVIIVTAGSLAEKITRPYFSKKNNKITSSGIPAFIMNADGTQGLISRQCTKDFKVSPVDKAITAQMRIHGTRKAVKWLGISTDEIYRIKESRRKTVKHRWPMIEKKMGRHDCLNWMKANGFPEPPRSACIFCPYRSNDEWRRLSSRDFQAAVAFERDFQAANLGGSMLGKPFLHRSMKPLSEVDFSTEEERGQLNMFNNECEGMCGV